jgi:hypothetical protein
VDLVEVQRLFLPTLRRKQGFLANLRFRRAPLPDWLKERNIEGTVQIRKLSIDGGVTCAFKARVAWTGASAQFTNATCVQQEMDASGRIAVNLAGALPQYRLSGKIEGFESRNGSFDVQGDLQTAGIGSDLLLNATSTGIFAGSDIRLSNDTILRDVTGSYQLSAGITGPRLALTQIEATDGVDMYTGQGTGLADGRIVLDLTTAAKRQVKLTGSLFPARPAPVQ